MITETAIGGKNDGKRGKEIKSFPERYEISFRKMIGENLSREKRVDGTEVYVVEDLDKLIFNIMEFYEGIKK